MVDVPFSIYPHFAVVSVQFERTAVMLVGVFLVRKDDGRASTIGLEINVKERIAGGIDDAEDTPISYTFKHLNLGADAVKNSDVNVGDVLWLVDVGHFSSF